MEKLDEAYCTLRRFGLCESKVKFSREWLGASASYLTSMEARARQPHMTALVGLTARLELLADQLAVDPHHQEHVRLLNELIDDLWDEVRTRALAAAPKRRAGRDACGA